MEASLCFGFPKSEWRTLNKRLDEDSDEAKVWQIVGEPEANPREQKISVISPVARALIGKRKGAVVEVQAPGGPKEYHMQKVEWLADGPPAKQTA